MNKVVHFEIPADDLERAKKFYAVFGWIMEEWPMENGDVYTGIRTVDVDEQTRIPKEPGAINGGLVKRSPLNQTPQVTINVPDMNKYLKKVEAAGGKILMPKREIEGAGYYAYVSDTEGNLLGLWQDIPQGQ